MAIQRFRHVLFSPDDDVKAALDRLPNTATVSLDIEIYGLTDMALIQNVITFARQRGDVRVMNDRSQSAGPADKAALQALTDAGAALEAAKAPGHIAVKVVESTHGAIDHQKVAIVDGENGALDDSSSVWYGSYNFSDGAQKQDNTAVWTNDPGEVAMFQAKFDNDWTKNPAKPEWQITPTGGRSGQQAQVAA